LNESLRFRSTGTIRTSSLLLSFGASGRSTYTSRMWIDFFVAAAGASAALAGLVFVALSVNIRRILEHQHLPSRAGSTIATLILILVSSMAALIHQEMVALGVEILVLSICCWMLQIWSMVQAIRAQSALGRPVSETIVATTIGQLQVLPFIAGGILLTRSDPNGMYWVAGGVIAIFIFSVLNAWVLLVEILR